jgi:OCT family organic cation transporter-like MFS transporter 4/5
MDKFEDFLSKIRFGKYQIRIIITVVLTSFVLPVILLLIPMMERTPDFYYRTANQSILITDKDSFCNNTYYTLEFEQIYDKIEIDYSYIDNWAANLKFVCNTRKIFSLASTVFFVGSISSNYGLSKVPDMYGRRNIFIILNIVTTIALLQVCVLNNFSQIIIACFTVGLSSLNLSVGSIILNEVLDKKYSGIAMGLANSMFPLAGLINTLLIYFFANWKVFYFLVCLTSIICSILSFKYIKESPIWLKANGKNTDYIRIIRYIVEVNNNADEINQLNEIIKNSFGVMTEEEKVELYDDGNESFDTISEIIEETVIPKNTDLKLSEINFSYENKHSYNIKDLFMYQSIRIISFFFVYLWVVTGLSFYGLLLNLENLTGNIYVDSYVSYSGELFAEIYSGYLANKYGKSILLYSLIMSSIGSLTFTLFNNLFIKIPLLFIASIGIASSFNLLYIFTPQFFPINIRTVAVGFFSLSNRCAAGFVPILLNYFPNISFFIGLISAFAAVIVMFLPEVKGYNAGSEVAEKRIVQKHSIHTYRKRESVILNN